MRLRPKAPVAADAILVGDPGRALLLAQELLEEPRMSNHARGLWGYSGRTPGGRLLTIQATGMGGPSAAVVLADLAKLGVRRAIRIGTCTGIAADVQPGDLLVAGEAVAAGGSASSFGIGEQGTVHPDSSLLAHLQHALPTSRTTRIASVDLIPPEVPSASGAAAADMQTLAVLARGSQLGISVAAVLIVTAAGTGSSQLSDDRLEDLARLVGKAVAASFSTSS
ncbi:MAG: hypothetical protein WBM00_10775 [Solirubrobacterales bacterium]